jgi:hypothetical protein
MNIFYHPNPNPTLVSHPEFDLEYAVQERIWPVLTLTLTLTLILTLTLTLTLKPPNYEA